MSDSTTWCGGFQVKLWQVGRLMPQQLALHMEERCCLPVLYMSAWLLTGFASSFPLPFASRVMDVLLTDSYSEPTMKVGLSDCSGQAPHQKCLHASSPVSGVLPPT